MPEVLSNYSHHKYFKHFKVMKSKIYMWSINYMELLVQRVGWWPKAAGGGNRRGVVGVSGEAACR